MRLKSDCREGKNTPSIVLPKRVEERLREESKKREATEEEIIIEALTKTEIHLKLSEKCMGEAEEYLEKREESLEAMLVYGSIWMSWLKD